MIFKLHNSLFNILKENVQDAFKYVQSVNESDGQMIFDIKDKDVQEVQLLINDEVVCNGMNNQDTVNDLGFKLYKLYDEILYQKNNQK